MLFHIVTAKWQGSPSTGRDRAVADLRLEG
jgi:hypothetical protein